MPGTKIQEHSGSEKSVVWSAVDFADEEQRTEMFCMRFASAERARGSVRPWLSTLGFSRRGRQHDWLSCTSYIRIHLHGILRVGVELCAALAFG